MPLSAYLAFLENSAALQASLMSVGIAQLDSTVHRGLLCQRLQTPLLAEAFAQLDITVLKEVQRLFHAQEAHILDLQVDLRYYRVYRHLQGIM